MLIDIAYMCVNKKGRCSASNSNISDQKFRIQIDCDVCNFLNNNYCHNWKGVSCIKFGKRRDHNLNKYIGEVAENTLISRRVMKLIPLKYDNNDLFIEYLRTPGNMRV